MNAPLRPLPARRPYLTGAEVAFGVAMACTSGLAIIAHTFAGISLRFSAGAIVLPSAVILTGIILLVRDRRGRFHEFAWLLRIGAAWGLVSTVGYDAIRPVLVAALQSDFDPYKAMGIFGQLATGRPAGDSIATAVGWTYHFWNGISFGMMFALLRPRGGMIPGLVWAMILQALMMAVYPAFLEARLTDPGFLVSGIIGHGLWGLLLGWGVARAASRRFAS